MNVGVVGSRTFPQLKLVEWFVRDLPYGVTIHSGGAKGVDQAAEDYARARGFPVVVHKPNLVGCKERHEFTQRYYDRNQKIVDSSDLVVAFTEKDKGGTWDTIKRARRANKAVKVVRPSALFPGDSEFDSPEKTFDESIVEPSPQQKSRNKNKGAGPFQIRRVSLGSYALRRKRYIDSAEWADIVTMKDSKPQDLAEKMLPDFFKFFSNNNRLGYVHAITVSPRLIRNLKKDHVMDILGKRVAEQLGAEFVRCFDPWEKVLGAGSRKRERSQLLPRRRNSWEKSFGCSMISRRQTGLSRLRFNRL